jgi:hypothetical protein
MNFLPAGGPSTFDQRSDLGIATGSYQATNYSSAMAETPPSDNDPPSYFSPEQVDEIVAARAAIEQAKGVLMFVYVIDADTAFEMLRRLP